MPLSEKQVADAVQWAEMCEASECDCECHAALRVLKEAVVEQSKPRFQERDEVRTTSRLVRLTGTVVAVERTYLYTIQPRLGGRRTVQFIERELEEVPHADE